MQHTFDVLPADNLGVGAHSLINRCISRRVTTAINQRQTAAGVVQSELSIVVHGLVVVHDAVRVVDGEFEVIGSLNLEIKYAVANLKIPVKALNSGLVKNSRMTQRQFGCVWPGLTPNECISSSTPLVWPFLIA